MATLPVTLRSAASQRFTGTHTADTDIYQRSADATDVSDVTLYGTDANGVGSKATITRSAGEGKVEKNVVAAGWDSLVFAKYGGTSAGAIQIRDANGTAATGSIHVHSLPSSGDTLSIGLTGLPTTATFQTAVTANDHIKVESFTTAQADSIASWINDASTGPSSPVDTTNWQRAGTAPAGADAYVSATVSADNITVTDRIACARSLGWTFSSTHGGLTINAPSGGVDGTLLGTIAAATTTISTNAGLNLDDETLATKTLPAGIVEDFDAVQVRGPFALSIRLGTDPGGDITSSIQTSTDGTNGWTTATSTVANLNFSTAQTQYITGSDLFGEYARYRITSNSATTASEANIKFVYER